MPDAYHILASIQTTRSIRSIAEGSSTAPLLGSGDDAVDDEDDENDSWMEPRRHLDLAPVSVGGKKVRTHRHFLHLLGLV